MILTILIRINYEGTMIMYIDAWTMSSGHCNTWYVRYYNVTMLHCYLVGQVEEKWFSALLILHNPHLSMYMCNCAGYAGYESQEGIKMLTASWLKRSVE